MLDTLPPVILSRPEAVRRRRLRRRRRTAAWMAVVALVVVAAAVTAVVASGRVTLPALALPFTPTADDGWIPDGQTVSLDDPVPAVERLDPALRDALAAMAADAAADGLTLEITSGWRSAAYQQDLFDEAVQTYGSAEVARQYVARPADSSHVTGDAVDLGPLDLQFWLMQYGAGYGLCQIYANERWHWELATTPGGVCPEMLPDASAPRG